MGKTGFKHSLEFIKERFKNGCPQVRKWALEMLKERWCELDKETQLFIDFHKNGRNSK